MKQLFKVGQINIQILPGTPCGSGFVRWQDLLLSLLQLISKYKSKKVLEIGPQKWLRPTCCGTRRKCQKRCNVANAILYLCHNICMHEMPLNEATKCLKHRPSISAIVRASALFSMCNYIAQYNIMFIENIASPMVT